MNFKHQKNWFLILVGLMTLIGSNPSFASRARLLISGSGEAGAFLGTGGNAGSFSTDSNYNIFYNPAYIVESKSWMTIEKSNSPGTTAQGGFNTSLLDKYYVSLFFNRIESMNTITQASAGAGFNYTLRTQMRPVDFTFGMKFQDVKLGLGATYAAYRLNKDVNDEDLTLKLGASWMSFDPFIHYKVIGKNRLTANSNTHLTHKEITGGLRYTWGEWTPYLAYSFYEIAATGLSEKYRSYGVGLARNGRLTDNIQYVFSTGFWRSNRPVVKNGGNSYQSVLPITLSAEAEVISWLVLRAGLGYHLIDRNGDRSAADRTYARIGSTFQFGAFNMDWVVGNNSAATTSANEEDSMNAQAFDITNRFFTAASLTYNW